MNFKELSTVIEQLQYTQIMTPNGVYVMVMNVEWLISWFIAFI